MKPTVETLPGAVDGTGLFSFFLEDPYPFFLDSGIDNERLSRFSFIGSDPFLVFSSKGSECRVQVKHDEKTSYDIRGNPLVQLQKLMQHYNQPSNSAGEAIPFCSGGAAGYFSYDLGRFLENLPDRAEDDLNLPDCYFAFYDRAVVIDHCREETHLVSTGLPQKGNKKEERRDQRCRELRQRINRYFQSPPSCTPGTSGLNKGSTALPAGSNLQSNFDRPGYLEAVRKVQEYIKEGKIEQINLSQRMQAELHSSPWDLYLRLRRLNPAPFAAYLEYPEFTVASSSPERFLLQRGSRIETCPIKGTRRRGSTPVEDQHLKEELWNSPKERQELALIANLEKEELERACREGTVQIEELYRLESYATVHHLVSTVSGLLPETQNLLDVLPYTFPGGSITGTPKKQAMEIIEELEPHRRGVYTGSLGFIDFQGWADLNVVIRTFIIKGNQAYIQVGGGLLEDSNPEEEYQETLDKAKALLDALGFQV